jgi:pimeloyl-ACP methyl ester carboxylesterase
MKYLSSSQALADLAYFIKAQNMPERPWVVFGGSYGGSLSAWARLKYPHLIHASIAASAPLEPKIDYTQYMDVVHNAYRHYGSQACVDDIKSALDTVKKMMVSDRVKLSTDLQLCSTLPNFSTMSDLDQQTFHEILFDTMAGVVQYNKEGGPGLTVQKVCDTLAATDDKYAAFVEVRHQVVAPGDCINWDFKSFVDEVSSTQIDGSNMRSWTWQTATEFGFLQTSYNSMWGNFTLELFDQMFQHAYAPQFNLESLQVNALRTNSTYGSVDFRASNVLFFNGDIDPWHALSINEDIQLPVHVKTWFTPGTSHCAVLYPAQPYDRPELTQAREEAFTELSALLKQFF